ncbi:MAG: quinone-dependent dihydroorotate dehydrogenase [Rhodospirillaceae bacterium]|nr:quinone-dependent dihydroorotate dehydrogenase [Rhodospirillaceae bacterium]
MSEQGLHNLLHGLAPAVLRLLPPEPAHRLALRLLAAGLVPAPGGTDDPVLRIRLWGLDFPNPLGLAAGFDKDAQAVDALLRLGFGFVEVGSVTPLPQPGNPRPRLFRLTEDGAIINRMGFNSKGAGAMADRLRRRAAAGSRGIVGVNLGRNRSSPDAAADYCAGLSALGRYASYIVVNVSSPNTPGLRALQDPGPLRALLAAVQAARDALPAPRPPLLVKIAPDLEEADLAAISGVALAAGIDGLVVGNTTIARPPGLGSRHAGEAGGLSGRPLFAPSTATLGRMYRLCQGRLPLIGVGGIASGADAYEKVRQGASLLQLYTAFVYGGPRLIRAIKRDLAARLRAEGFRTLAEAVGSAHR